MEKIMALLAVIAAILGAFVTSSRVEAQSETQNHPFTFYPPGSIEPKSGAEDQLSTGYADYAVHAPDIGFPLKTPAFPNSQVYRPGGEHYALKGDGKWQCDSSNYSYPWRDNYCESRSWDVDDCQGGHGHQGQDIRPSTCATDTHEVRAVEAGKVREQPKAGVLIIMTHDEKRRYYYLHMETVRHKVNANGGLVLDDKGKPIEIPETRVTLKKGSDIHRGDIIGYVSTFADETRDMTSRHLHFGFQKQRFDSKGRVLSGGRYFYHSPYMSLVRAYETALGQTGTMLPVPQVCQPNTARCTTKSIITCNGDGTAETLTPCTTAQCKNDMVCKTGVAQPVPDMSVPVVPRDLSTSTPPDISVAVPPDLAPTCDPRACLCGCNGSSCRLQICSPSASYCTTPTILIECSVNGCTTTTRSCGYGCSGNRCNDPPGTIDMSTPPPKDMSTPPPGTEICNGSDDDGNGIIDDPASCWQWVTRFKDPITGARCYGVGSIPPFACAAYDREFVLFAVPTTQWSDGSNSLWVQCSRGIDHVLTKYNGTERTALEALGWNCSLQLGYFFNQGSGPHLPKKTPFTYTCPLYRQKFTTSGSQSHFFTPYNESVSSATCESPARADVVTSTGCGVPPGC